MGESQVTMMYFKVLWKDGAETWETSDKFLCDNTGILQPYVEQFEETLVQGTGHDMVGSCVRIKTADESRTVMLMEWISGDKYNVEFQCALSEQEFPESLRVASIEGLDSAPVGSWVVFDVFESPQAITPEADENPQPRVRRGKLRPLLGMRVAIVDDSKSSIQVVVAHICREGGAVEYFDSGTSFLHQAQRHPGRFDCVVLDYVMPGMSGLEVLSHLRQIPVPQNKRAPMVVVLSSGVEKISEDAWCSYVPQGIHDTFEEAGANALVRKTTLACKEIIQLIVRHIMRRTPDDSSHP